MRKFYLISLLATVAMTYGCGYGDGKDVENTQTVVDEPNGPLPQLAMTCLSNSDCKIGRSIMGDCLGGVCRRFCDSTDDCEENTVCEAGFCQPVVACPEVTFADSSKANALKDKKCVKVFKVSPTLNWSNLRKSDLHFNQDNSDLFGKSTDFTSPDYTLELRNDSINNGLNFSMVTFLTLSYIKLMIGASSLVAECVKPQWNLEITAEDDEFKNKKYIEINDYVDIPGLNYNAPYAYSIPNNAISPMSMLTVCIDASYEQNEDMLAYHSYLTAPSSPYFRMAKLDAVGKQSDPEKAMELMKKIEFERPGFGISPEDIDYATLMALAVDVMTSIHQYPLSAYKEMIEKKPVCKTARDVLQLLMGMSELVTKLGLTTTESYEAASATFDWLTSGLENTTVLQTDFDQSLIPNAESLNLNLNKKLGTFPVIACNEETWRNNVRANEKLRRTLLMQESEEDYKSSKDYIDYCSEADAGVEVSTDEDKADAEKVGDKLYKFNLKDSTKANLDMFEHNVKRSLLSTCIYIMQGLNHFGVVQAMSRASGVQLNKCSKHDELVDATINTEDLSPSFTQVFSLLENTNSVDGLKDVFKTYKLEQIMTMLRMLDAGSLYTSAADPGYIWLSGSNLFPLVINNDSGGFKNNDLLMDVVYQPAEAIFEATASSQPIAGNVKFTGYQDGDVVEDGKGGYQLKSDLNNEYISSFTYSNTLNAESHGVLMYHREHNGCPNGKCTFYWYGEKVGSLDMICGGVTAIIKHIDGYIVLDKDDPIGKRKVSYGVR